jgi:hypothetical protein
VLRGLQFLRDRFAEFGDRPALIWHDTPYSYAWLLQALDEWRDKLHAEQITPATVVSLTPGAAHQRLRAEAR